MSINMLAAMPLFARVAQRQVLRTGSAITIVAPQALAPLQSAISLDRRAFSFRANPKHAKPIDTKRVIETSVVENADNKFMRWVGRGSAMQMYCTIIFAGKLILEANPGANVYEVWAASGALASASACVFFGAKILCDKIVTDVASCRNSGEKDEFVRLTVQGALAKYALHVSLEDIQLIEHKAPDKYKFKVGARNFSLDVSNARCANRKTLENLLTGKPLVSRKGKQPKHKR